MNLVDNKYKKKGEGTRAEMRKKDENEKAIDAKNDSTYTRGFTTNQRIDIESLSMQKETMVDRKNEEDMVALSLEESALKKLIDAAERRAIFCCPEYNADNPYWKRVEVLMKEQETLMEKIRGFNENIMTNNASAFTVSEFLNEPSPMKPSSNKRKSPASDSNDTISVDSSGGDTDGDDISSTEKIMKAKVTNNKS